MDQGRSVDEREAAVEAEAGGRAGRAEGGAPASPRLPERADDAPPGRELAELQSRFDEVKAALERTRGQLDAAERRGRIDQALVESGAADLEAARLLTEAAVEQMDEADVGLAVEELRRGRPYLFRRGGSGGASARDAGGGVSGAMAARPRGVGDGGAEDAAREAASSGDRRDLLRYLRMRRGRGARS